MFYFFGECDKNETGILSRNDNKSTNIGGGGGAGGVGDWSPMAEFMDHQSVSVIFMAGGNLL